MGRVGDTWGGPVVGTKRWSKDTQPVPHLNTVRNALALEEGLVVFPLLLGDVWYNV
jgi:hypothetical protein